MAVLNLIVRNLATNMNQIKAKFLKEFHWWKIAIQIMGKLISQDYNWSSPGKDHYLDLLFF